MVESKPSRPPECNELNIPTDGNKVQAYMPNIYRGKKPQNKPSPEPKTKTSFQGQCTDLKGYTFDLGPRASAKFSRTMKELYRYIGATYSDSYQPDIMTETASNFPDPEMHNITDLGIERPKTDGDMTYLEKHNIDKAMCQNLRKKDVYKSDMQKIYNLILGQTNKQLKEKAALYATFQEFKTDQDPIVNMMILKIICFSNQSEQHPIRSLCMSNENTTNYLFSFRNAQKFNKACNGSLITKVVQ